MGRKKALYFHTYNHNFGIVLPMKTGVFWEQQTRGVLCDHVSVEGIYIPLRYPKFGRKDLLAELSMANYSGNWKNAVEVWRQIKEWLSKYEGLEFEEVEAPEDMPENQEGLQWVKIVKWDSPLREFSYGDLEGKIVALYYPNSD